MERAPAQCVIEILAVTLPIPEEILMQARSAMSEDTLVTQVELARLLASHDDFIGSLDTHVFTC